MTRRSAAAGATISQVAAAAGVSSATVSRVMNGRATVAPDIADRVRAVAAELRYRPSNSARNLSLGRTGTVALVVPDIANPVFQQVMRGAVDVAEAAEHRVLVAETAGRAEREVEIVREARSRCDAVVLVSPAVPDQELRRLLVEVAPVVLVNRTVPGASAPSVSVDHGLGLHLLVEHLLGLGHRHLAHLAGPATAAASPERERTLQDAVRRWDDVRVTTLAAGSRLADGYAVADDVLETRATAVVAFNDLVAFGVLARLNETGVAVPDDLSVAGFDGIELGSFATPALTTASVDQADLGRRAMTRLLDLVGGRTDGDFGLDVLEPRLLVRSSTGPVPPARRPARPPASRAPRAALEHEPAHWVVEGTGARLHAAGTVLARLNDGSATPKVHSPRPFLHPVHTLAGFPVTASGSVLHRHQNGLSLALPDVDGTNHWGGRTYVDGQGPMLLMDHGRQEVDGLSVDPDGLTLAARVRWTGRGGDVQFVEDRRLGAQVVPEDETWFLHWHSTLVPERDTTLTSPVARGRPGAGYGGIFWRLAPADETTVFTDAGEGEPRVMGSRTPWLAFVRRHGQSLSSVLLVQTTTGDPHPWFARCSDYVAGGPAIAWDAPLVLPAHVPVDLGLTTVVVDRGLDRASAARLADEALARRA
ncbi:DUF6807 family protein [Kineococcus rhizosphaerae]|uniref:LacI family transcriptional regulator n=1 Tax=Kineococcus rhizosphaerae TaxID=559628 RepID=A0A2T0QXB3_9ACTN|nr:DUF6807 family protein [Kineococcus rhizosphaerae]PRY10535.1 LacI family transcriptional regulator [Kineococcus rhizosphaerae]